jgi:hypothetical protein
MNSIFILVKNKLIFTLSLVSIALFSTTRGADGSRARHQRAGATAIDAIRANLAAKKAQIDRLLANPTDKDFIAKAKQLDEEVSNMIRDLTEDDPDEKPCLAPAVSASVDSLREDLQKLRKAKEAQKSQN